MKFSDFLVKNTSQLYWLLTVLVAMAYLGPISDSYSMQNRCINAELDNFRAKDGGAKRVRENWSYYYLAARRDCGL